MEGKVARLLHQFNSLDEFLSNKTSKISNSSHKEFKVQEVNILARDLRCPII